jgi:hypothetical protein
LNQQRSGGINAGSEVGPSVFALGVDLACGLNLHNGDLGVHQSIRKYELSTVIEAEMIKICAFTS